MEQSPSWEANSSSATQLTARILSNLKVQYRIHNNPLFSPVPRPLCMIKFLRWRFVSTSPNPQAGGPPLVGCPLLLIQYIHSYPPYLQAFPPSATWGLAKPWWQGPTYYCDRDPLITVTGTHLSLWQGPTYHGNYNNNNNNNNNNNDDETEIW
jgi:hypothetical protein